MDTQPPPPAESGSNSGRLAGAISNTEILGTQQERRHKLVHRDALFTAPLRNLPVGFTTVIEIRVWRNASPDVTKYRGFPVAL